MSNAKNARADLARSSVKESKAAATPTDLKHVQGRSPEPGAFHDLNPAWRVGRLRLRAPHGWNDVDRVATTKVLERLKSFETMTWKDILVRDKHENHSIPVDRLSSTARKCLLEDWQGADQVISLRIMGKERVFGVIDRGAMALLWWDPDHLVCPAPKKHT